MGRCYVGATFADQVVRTKVTYIFGSPLFLCLFFQHRIEYQFERRRIQSWWHVFFVGIHVQQQIHWLNKCFDGWALNKHESHNFPDTTVSRHFSTDTLFKCFDAISFNKQRTTAFRTTTYQFCSPLFLLEQRQVPKRWLKRLLTCLEEFMTVTTVPSSTRAGWEDERKKGLTLNKHRVDLIKMPFCAFRLSSFKFNASYLFRVRQAAADGKYSSIEIHESTTTERNGGVAPLLNSECCI